MVLIQYCILYQILYCTPGIRPTPKRVTSWQGPSPGHCFCEQHTAPFEENVPAVANRWQQCVRFDQP